MRNLPVQERKIVDIQVPITTYVKGSFVVLRTEDGLEHPMTLDQSSVLCAELIGAGNQIRRTKPGGSS